MTEQQFALACTLLPPDVEWGDALSPARVLHIRAQARAELIAELKPVAWMHPNTCHIITAGAKASTGDLLKAYCDPLAIIPKE